MSGELKHDSAPTLTRWGPRPVDARSPEERRAEFEAQVRELRLRIAAEGYLETPGGALSVPVLVVQRKDGR